VQWIPHLMINPERDIWKLHRQILGFHQNLGVGKTEPVHPYCSPWWSWVLLIRPVAYFYKNRPNGTVEFVHAMGNPFLYWLSAIALLYLIFLITSKLRFYERVRAVFNNASSSHHQELLPYKLSSLPKTTWLAIYVTTSFAAHWLPWSLSRRCIFLYHYMPASIFAFMALALVVSLMWRSTLDIVRAIGIGIFGIVAIAFLFWLPIYIGLPISSGYLPVLMWFRSWI